MRFFSLKIALDSLLLFKVRTLLAVVGIGLGTLALVVVFNLTGSLKIKTTRDVNRLGENILIVRSGLVVAFAGQTRVFRTATTLKETDAHAIKSSIGAVLDVTSVRSRVFPVRSGEITIPRVTIMGVEENFPQIRNFYPERGQFITREDNLNAERVVVLGKRIAEKLFPNEDPIGKHILIWRVPCYVIGIMEEKGADLSGNDQDSMIFIPLKTFLTRFLSQDYIDTIFVKVTNQGLIASTKGEIETLLRERHGIKKGKDDDFTVIDMRDVLELQISTSRIVTILGLTTAGISFIIGAIGILSIMILIVNERRLEIGIRRAVGATKKDILQQFIMESSAMAIFGGIVGMFLGFLISILVFKFSQFPFYISLGGIVFSFIISSTMGILAGLYPANLAIKVEPMEVLRT